MMKKIELEVPDDIFELPESEKDKLMNTVLSISIKERLKKLKKEAKKAEKKINKFEKKYGFTLEKYEKNGIGNSLEEHDDYMDWFYWKKVYQNSKQLITKYKSLLGDEINVS